MGAPSSEGAPSRRSSRDASSTSQSTKRSGLLGSSWGLIGISLTILSVLFLAFFFDMTVLSGFRQARDQKVEYATYRYSLANSTAPVGQLDATGNLYPWGTPVAYLSIPSLQLKQVVGEGTTASVLMSGPGHRRDTPFPGQPGISMIFGRQASYGGPFRNIHTLKRGASILVTTGQGVQHFKVIGVRKVGDISPALLSGASRLVLVTAAGQPYEPDGVLYVDAALVSPVQAYPPRPLNAAGLLPSEKAMAGESSAWLPLVLWGQLFLIAALVVAWATVRWGTWQAWLVGVPVLLVLGIAVADQIARLFPNLM